MKRAWICLSCWGLVQRFRREERVLRGRVWVPGICGILRRKAWESRRFLDR